MTGVARGGHRGSRLSCPSRRDGTRLASRATYIQWRIHLQPESTWTLSALEALRNALYKFKTYLLTFPVSNTSCRWDAVPLTVCRAQRWLREVAYVSNYPKAETATKNKGILEGSATFPPQAAGVPALPNFGVPLF